MSQFEFTVTVEHENEISAGAQQIAADLAAQAAANAVEESGGGVTTANGVIEGGRGSATANKGKGDKA